MAEQLNGTENDSIEKYRLIRTALHETVWMVVDSITNELRVYQEKTSNPRLELYLKLLGQKRKEVKQLDEKIQSLSSPNEFYEDVRRSQGSNFHCLYKIISATMRNEEKEMILPKMEELFPMFQIPAFQCSPKDSKEAEAELFEDNPCRPRKKRCLWPRPRVFKLPILEMPKFNGNLLKWVEFWDIFETLVHGDSTMNNALKFTYLKVLLTGDEFNFIKNMGTNDENYERAVTILKSRYGNIDTLVSLHQRALRDMKPVNKNCSDLREFFHDMESNICALETLEAKIDSPSLVTSLLNKLPLDLKQRICKKRKLSNHELITMDILKDELYLELQNPQD